MTTQTANLIVQKWGNSLAVRIPSNIARCAHFRLGTHVQLAVEDGNVVVKSVENQKLTLEERLELFDPKKHGGEIMSATPIGLEKF